MGCEEMGLWFSFVIIHILILIDQYFSVLVLIDCRFLVFPFCHTPNLNYWLINRLLQL